MADYVPGNKGAAIAIVIALSAAGYGAWVYFGDEITDRVPLRREPSAPAPAGGVAGDLAPTRLQERIGDLLDPDAEYHWTTLAGLVNPCAVIPCADGVMNEAATSALRIALVREGWYERSDAPGIWRHDSAGF